MTSPMTYSKSGLAVTESFEGCKLTAYQDIRGVWTIGYGHTGPDVTPGMTITAAQAEALLMDDISFSANCVNNCVNVALTQPEFDALVDFVYNVGCKNFANSTMRRMLNAEDYAGAAGQFALWDHAAGKVVAGLLRRRQAEMQEFQS